MCNYINIKGERCNYPLCLYIYMDALLLITEFGILQASDLLIPVMTALWFKTRLLYMSRES